MKDSNGPVTGPQTPAVIDQSTPGISAAWLVPIAVAAVVFMVFWRGWTDSGIAVRVDFDAAHGLQVGDPVRCRGVSVGEVNEVTLRMDGGGDSASDTGIRVELRVHPTFEEALRADTAFWIERPQFDLRGVDGLETIASGRFVGVLPGDGPASRGPFQGMAMAPGTLPRSAGDLIVTVESPQRSGLRVGGPVTYRGVRIGEIDRVQLGDAANGVEARIVIDRRYRDLVRERSRFFSTSGVGLQLGLDGLRADIGSLEELVVGGVGLATPPDAGPTAESGDRFLLAERAEPEWLDWQPSIAWRYDAPSDIDMMPIAIRYQEGLLRRPVARRGWVVRLGPEEFAVPRDLLQAPNNASDVRVYLGTASSPLAGIGHRPFAGREGLWSRFHGLESIDGVRILEIGDWSSTDGAFPSTRADEGETLLVVSGRSVGNVPVPGHLWRRTQTGIELLDVTGLYDSDHGAPVVSAATGELIGLLDRRGGGWGVVEIE